MFPYIDLHCDTISMMYRPGTAGAAYALDQNDRQIDLDKLSEGGCLCQCFSLFTYLKETREAGIGPYDFVTWLADHWIHEISKYPDRIRQVRSYTDIMENQKAGIISAMMTGEEGAVFEGSIDKLHALYDKGMRITTLTWNFVNELGYPNPNREAGMPYLPDETHGLTATGKEFVMEMERLGILTDLSHLNDAGIRDVLQIARGPVIATHSNARGLCYHLRNLTDENIRGIAEHGGVIGINFYPGFLTEQPEGIPYEDEAASTADMIAHMQYIKKVGGIDCLALGSDFDGYDGTTDIAHAGQMQHLAEVMAAAGFTGSEIEKVFAGNALRVFKDVLR